MKKVLNVLNITKKTKVTGHIPNTFYAQRSYFADSTTNGKTKNTFQYVA